MISNISFQSITESATQMTFNTFHFGGTYVKNLIFGFSILKEVINVFKRLKTPSMKIYLTPEIIYENETKEQKEWKIFNNDDNS